MSICCLIPSLLLWIKLSTNIWLITTYRLGHWKSLAIAITLTYHISVSFINYWTLSHQALFCFLLTFLTDSLRDYSYICIMWFCQLRLHRSPAWWLGATCAIKKTRHGSCCCACTGCRYSCLLHDSLRSRWDIYLPLYVFRVCTGSGIQTCPAIFPIWKKSGKMVKSLEFFFKAVASGLQVIFSFGQILFNLDCTFAAIMKKALFLLF